MGRSELASYGCFGLVFEKELFMIAFPDEVINVRVEDCFVLRLQVLFQLNSWRLIDEPHYHDCLSVSHMPIRIATWNHQKGFTKKFVGHTRQVKTRRATQSRKSRDLCASFFKIKIGAGTRMDA